MKNKKTYYHLVLDRSGSMHSCWPETLAGFSNQVDKIRELAVSYPEQSFYASLCTFNHVASFPHGISPVDGQTSLSLDGIRPEGHTALFDAI
ncbi:MAG TPA: hypothetical protein VFX48_06665, partial [Saprospiraceae bacterium]|nr:hypothetical protein [Saprospiraceae bacterium]